MGASTATTARFEASSARFAAVLSIDQPPQLKPMIMVTTAPTTAPWTRRLNEWSCKIEGSGMSCPSIKRSKSGGHPDGCRLNEFFEGPTPCVGVTVDHYARLLNECRCKTIAATQSFRVRSKIMVANWTPAALKHSSGAQSGGRWPVSHCQDAWNWACVHLSGRPANTIDISACPMSAFDHFTASSRSSRHFRTEVADSFDYLADLPERRRPAGKQFYASLASAIAS